MELQGHGAAKHTLRGAASEADWGMIDDPASASTMLRRSIAEGLGEEAILCLAMAFEVIVRATRPRTESCRWSRLARVAATASLPFRGGYETHLDRASWTWPKNGFTASMVTYAHGTCR